jgi:hypothetical protein
MRGERAMFHHKRGHQEFTEEPEPDEPKAEAPKHHEHHFNLGVIDSIEEAVTNAFHPHYSEQFSPGDLQHQREENDHDQRR